MGYLPASVSEAAVAGDADRRQVSASPIGRFALAPVGVNGLVLGFGGVAPPLIDAGVEVLAQVLENRLAPARARRSAAKP